MKEEEGKKEENRILSRLEREATKNNDHCRGKPASSINVFVITI